MTIQTPATYPQAPQPPAVLDELPLLYEDEEEGDMGESDPHVVTTSVLHVCLKAHLTRRPEYRVFANMNLYYRDDKPHPRTGSLPYVSPDVMVVVPSQPLGDDVVSYKIGVDGPVPLFVGEVLSERSAQQRDLDQKVDLYAKLGVVEYVLLDPRGKYLPQRLLLKRLRTDRMYDDEQDSDGGVTSRLGFRLLWEADNKLRVLDAAIDRRYVRPEEAEAAQRQAEERIRALEAELNQLRAAQQKPTRRRKKS